MSSRRPLGMVNFLLQSLSCLTFLLQFLLYSGNSGLEKLHRIIHYNDNGWILHAVVNSNGFWFICCHFQLVHVSVHY